MNEIYFNKLYIIHKYKISQTRVYSLEHLSVFLKISTIY